MIEWPGRHQLLRLTYHSEETKTIYSAGIQSINNTSQNSFSSTSNLLRHPQEAGEDIFDLPDIWVGVYQPGFKIRNSD